MRTIENQIKSILTHQSNFEGNGSNFILNKIEGLGLWIANFLPVKSRTFVDLPDSLKNHLDEDQNCKDEKNEKIVEVHCLTNVESSDDKCFLWAILAKLYFVDSDKTETKSYEANKDKINIWGINFPVLMKDIKLFEKKYNLSINIFKYN